jgi:FlaA1/EpsC-like NDP-sugar epimerase
MTHSERRIVGIRAGAPDLPLLDYFCRSYRDTARIVGFVDVNEFLRRKKIHGVPVLGTLSEIESIHARHTFEEMVVLGGSLGAEEQTKIVNFARNHGLILRSLRLMSEEMTEQPDGTIVIAYSSNGVRHSPVAD